MKLETSQRADVSHRRRVLFTVLALLVFLTFGGGRSALAQDPTPAPAPTPTEEERRLQEQKRLLELQRDIELAKKAIRDAQPTPPEPTATPLAGDTTLAEVRIETAFVAYTAMSHVADAVAKEVSSRVSSAKNLLIYDADVIRDWRFHQALFPAFRGQIADIKARYAVLLCDDPDVSPLFKQRYCLKEGVAIAPSAARRESFVPFAALEAIGAGETLIRSFIDIAALFRTETKIEGVPVTIDESAFVAELSRALKNQYCRTQARCFPLNVYYPTSFHPRIRESETIFMVGLLSVFQAEAGRIIRIKTAGRPPLVNQLNEALAELGAKEATLQRVRALQAIIDNLNKALAQETVPFFRNKLWEEKTKAEVELRKLDSEADLLKDIADLTAQVTGLRAKIRAIDNTVRELTDLNDRFQRFLDQFIKVDDKGSNPLAMFIKSEDIDAIVNSGESYWLEIKPITGGGNNRTRKNLIWFFLGARLDHSGGVIAQYTLFDQQGAIVSSDKIAYYHGYVEPKNIRRGRLKDPVP